ncbi:MAG: hypothetical protein K2N73_15895 [Lachnospiraceae bacterium]|nr:hypothetical protein [Lachnospiraceae bacterium]
MSIRSSLIDALICDRFYYFGGYIWQQIVPNISSCAWRKIELQRLMTMQQMKIWASEML